MRAASMAWLPLVGLAACASSANDPPAFQIEPRDLAAPRPGAEWISIGSPSSAPPGEQRFARIYADGRAESREVFTPNGPGRSLTLIGTVRVEPSVVKAALATAETFESSSSDRLAPCVVAVNTSATRWQGCAHSVLAARLLDALPRLTVPDVSPSCTSPWCQVRIVRESLPGRHEQYGDVRQDRLLDSTGAFRCASGVAPSTVATVTMQVERGAIAEIDALRVFQWVVADVVAGQLASKSFSDPRVARVMVRADDGEWRTIADAAAVRVRQRWDQIASRLPEACRWRR